MKYLASLLLMLPFSLLAQPDENKFKAGDKAPNFTFEADGNSYQLDEMLAENDYVLVIFYRGHWCPVCNRHLAAFQKELGLLSDYNLQILGVSPQLPEYGDKTKEKNKLEFELVYDEGYRIMRAFGVDFTLDKKTKKRYRQYGLNIEETNGNNDYVLPVPATFLIDKTGEIVWMHYNPNYKKRADVKDILDALEEM